MKLLKTIMVLQSSTTGRVLLKRRGDVWGFASEMNWNKEEAMLFNGLNELKTLMGFDDDFDGLVIDFVGNISGIQMFHCVVESEPAPTRADADWFSLFNFPENFDPMNNRVFDHNLFIEKIISPDN